MLHTLYRWYGKRTVLIVGGLVAALIVFGIFYKFASEKAPDSEEAVVPIVKVAPAAAAGLSDKASFVGTVRSVSEADIKAEVGGRVTSVPVELGQKVTVGAVIATLENSAQQAAVLQAEGAYEAAVAAAAQSDISGSQAQISLKASQDSLIATLKGAYSSSQNILYSDIDVYFTKPNEGIIGLKNISGGSSINPARETLRTTLPAWKNEVDSLNANSDLFAATDLALLRIDDITVIVNFFITKLNNPETTNLTEAERTAALSSFISTRSSLESLAASLRSSRSALENAEDAYEKSKLASTGTTISSANAGVKQALGSLRAAQSNLAKTILRSPISGDINVLTAHVGDFISPLTSVAKVANNNASEITIYAGENDLPLFTVGAAVTIEGEYEGVVTNIAAGVDSATQKTQIKIGTDALTLSSGDTVEVSLVGMSSTATESQQPIYVPLTAVKFTSDNGSVFTVENGVLVSHDVVLGSVRGSSVEIVSGISGDSEIVLDARGLTVGSKVEAVK